MRRLDMVKQGTYLFLSIFMFAVIGSLYLSYVEVDPKLKNLSNLVVNEITLKLLAPAGFMAFILHGQIL